MLPASNTPTTVHPRLANESVSLWPAFWNRWAIPSPTMISDKPGRGMRPAVMRTWGRSAREDSEVPRMVTLEVLSEPRLRRLMSTTTSRAASGRPPGPSAISG